MRVNVGISVAGLGNNCTGGSIPPNPIPSLLTVRSQHTHHITIKGVDRSEASNRKTFKDK